jgi:hypothetical protein
MERQYHRPQLHSSAVFRWRVLNGLFALYLSAVLGIPQTLWRDRQMAVGFELDCS